MLKVLLFAGVLALAGWLLMRVRQAGNASAAKKVGGNRAASRALGKTSAANTKSGATSDWHSVTILSSFNACDAAKALEGKVFLATEAPSLPLADCDNTTCRCHYGYLDDRRQEDRRTPYGERHGARLASNASDRRQPGNRREVD
jgi:hypothetical protein